MTEQLGAAVQFLQLGRGELMDPHQIGCIQSMLGAALPRLEDPLRHQPCREHVATEETASCLTQSLRVHSASSLCCGNLQQLSQKAAGETVQSAAPAPPCS